MECEPFTKGIHLTARVIPECSYEFAVHDDSQSFLSGVHTQRHMGTKTGTVQAMTHTGGRQSRTAQAAIDTAVSVHIHGSA